MADPRPSTDEETAPLLDNDAEISQSPFHTLFKPTRPLTSLEKLLMGAAVLFLLLMSTFIGLFAGAEGMLKKERGKSGHIEWKTETKTATATSVYTTTVQSQPTGKPESKVCLTQECVMLSASILQSINTTVDPCDDFYQFATGGWQSTHEIPPSRGLYGAFNEVSDNNKKIILKVLNSIPSSLDAASSAETDNLHKLKLVYTSCMDIETLNKVGLTHLTGMFDFVLDTFAPFDVIPAPDEEMQVEKSDWRGTWDDSYTVSNDLAAAAAEVEFFKSAKNTGRIAWQKPEGKGSFEETELDAIKVDKDRQERITKTLAYLHSRGVQALLNFAIEGDAGGEDSQVQSLWLYQTFGGLPSKEYYAEKPILDLYQSVIKNILIEIASHTKASTTHPKRDLFDDLVDEIEAVAANVNQDEIEVEGWPWPWPGDDDRGGNKDKNPPEDETPAEKLNKRMEKLSAKVVDFEKSLMEAGADPEYLFNPHFAYNPYPTPNVSKALPFLDIPSYLSTYAPRSYPTKITVTHPPYLKSVSKIVSSTPDYVLSGYFVTRLALTYASALGPAIGIRQETKRLEEVLRGIKKGTPEDRQDVCLNWVDNIVGFIAGGEFVREAFSAEAKAEGEHIIRSIVKAFEDKLPEIPWMDEKSAKAAQKKAEAIIPKIGYPLYPNTTDPESLQRYYSGLEVHPDDFFASVSRTALLDEWRSWLTLGRVRNRESWEMYPQTVNAYYSPPDGEIVFPAGILQPPFYSQAWPSHLRYGAFGAVAAHELTHAFDNSGSQYDERGRLRDWWTNSTVAAFEERAQCVAKQYSKYYVYDEAGNKVYVNGNLTNGEDIADSGVAQAYSAWKASIDSSSEKAQNLPGLDYTPDQLFFLAYARVWAQLTKPATAVSRVRTDPHSPPYWRTVGTLRNLKAFHEAFQCKAGSGMNPPKKDQCELW